MFPDLRKQLAVARPARRAQLAALHRSAHGAARLPVVQARLKAALPGQRVVLRVALREILRVHARLSPEARRQRALEAMIQAELPDPESLYRKYPHELSGGMLQRVMIASAIISGPKLLLADEPTTALDVTIQTQILELLKKLNREHGMAILFISHNLHVVQKLCTRVAVMQGGHLVETGLVQDIFQNPRQEYTRRLIAAIPTRNRKLT